ncbi:MAG: hypothetical protein MUF51_04560 [Vicinamibacteria bacterium]|nr:hypothetical protein [Vicinamibacteria bacterium]
MRGRRGERLEARIREAQQIADQGDDLAAEDQGDDLAAERIVTSALKLIPNHAKALALFSELRNRRLAPQTAEAEAERELTGLARQRAATGLAQARTAFANGQARRAMMLTRRALRLAPDHAELLALYTEIERQLARTLSVGMLDVRRALTLVNEGRLDEGLELLRALLRDNPDHADAQAAVQEVRRLYARQTSLSLPAAPAPPAPVIAAPRPQSEDHTSPTRDARPALRAPARPAATPVLRERPTTVPATPPTPVRAPRAPLATAAPESPPARVVRIPPSLLIAFIGLVVLAIGASFWWRSRPASLPAPSLPPAAAPTTAPAGAPGVNALASLDPDLRHTIETTLAQYARTLETVNASLLAEVRPDLDSAAREQLLATFEGSINVAVDIRVIEVTSEANATEIMIQRTAVLVGQQNNPLPVIERLRFVRQAEGWALVRAK